jgi:hypothetical protein
MRLRLKIAVLGAVLVAGAIALGVRVIGSPTPEPQGLIGVQVGIQVGPQVGVQPGLLGSAGSLIVMFGDSITVGQANANPVAAPLEFGVGSTFSAVTLASQQAANTTDPPPFGAEIGPEALQAYNPGGTPGFGAEITLGRQLNAISSQFGYLVKCGITASLLKTHWLPNAAYWQASSGGSLYKTEVARVHSYEALSGSIAKIVYVNLDTNDASDATASSQVAANMTTEVTQLHADFPSAVIVWPLIHSGTVQTNTATVRTQELTYAGTAPSYFMLIDIDDMTLQDTLHPDTNSMLTIGQRVAFAGTDLLGIARQVVSGAPQIVGAGVPMSGSAATLTPLAWPGTTDNDTELLIGIASGVTPGGGAGTMTVSTPAGWTSVTNGQITAVGFTTTWRVLSRAVGAGEVETNPTPPAQARRAASVSITFAQSTDNIAKRITIRGPNPHPTVDQAASTQPNQFTTGPVTIGSQTTTADNELVIDIVGGGAASTPDASSFTAAGLSNVAKYSESFYPMPSSDSVTLGIWTGTLAAHGATGTKSLSFAVNTLVIDSEVTIKP